MIKIKKEGLTLLEVLIATAIFSIIILSIYSVFQTGIFSYKRIDSAFQLYQSARISFKRIELDLKNSFSYSEDNSKFSGNKEALDFFSAIDFFEKGEALSHISRIKYELNSDRLRRICYRGLDAVEGNQASEPEELVAGIKEVSFQYAANNPDKGYQWQESWPEAAAANQQKGLPLAVKIELSLLEKDKSQQNPAAITFTKVVFLPLSEKSSP